MTVKQLMDGRDALALVDWRNGFSNGGNFLELHRDGKIIDMGDCNTYSTGCDASNLTLVELRDQVVEWLGCVVDCGSGDPDGDDYVSAEDIRAEALEQFDALLRNV